MLDAIKHITDDKFFFQEDSAQVHCVCVIGLQSNWVKMWFSCFPVSPCIAEAQVIWGGIVRRLLIACFIVNVSAKKYQNPFMCVKVIASQRWDVFWDTVYIVAMIIYHVSLWCMCNCACDWWSSKFTFTFKFMLLGLPRVPGYPSGTRVINYPGNFLLPDGYPGS